MAIKYGFFNSVNGDRKYNAEDVGRYLKGIINSGVYPDSTTSLQVLIDEGMAVQVLPGRAMLEYHYLENDSPLVLTLAAGGTQARIDAIVARLDLENRLCEIAIKEGTPAAAPTPPAMSRTDVKSEYMLASVYVGALASTITQDDITDTRSDSTVCGWVRGVIKQETVTIPVPTSSMSLYIPTVNKDGDGYELMPTDTTLSFEGAIADAAATGAGIKEAKDVAGAAQSAAAAAVEAVSSHEHDASAITSGAIPIERGGTGSGNGATAIKNLLAAGNTILSSYQYGDTLPTAGTKGRIFFKKVT